MALKDHPENSEAGRRAKAAAEKADATAASKVATAVAVETGPGFRGVEVDPTPNENYTVAGVIAGLPTPETDAEAAAAAQRAVSGVEQRAAGAAGR